MVDGFKHREVIVLERHPARREFAHVGVHVACPEAYLRMFRLVRRWAPVHEERGSVPTCEQQVVLDRLWRQLQADPLLVELLAPLEIS